MNYTAIHHEAKSRYAYAYDKKTLHLRLRTGRNDIEQVTMIAGDPFDWHPDPQEPSRYKWHHEGADRLELVKEYQDDLFDYWFIAYQPPYKRTRYGFILQKEEDRVLYGAKGLVDLKAHPASEYDLMEYFNFPYLNQEDLYNPPGWVKDTVWYQIFPERFANGDPSINPDHTRPWASEEEVTNEMRFGGDLKGVLNHLEELSDLGINGIYFTPIFTAKTQHKYDTMDYYEIDPVFGDKEVFATLVRAAHEKGIRIMLDGVFNHCGFHHPYWLDVMEKGQASQYYDYFHIKGDPRENLVLEDGHPYHNPHHNGVLNYETFAFTPNMPKWNTMNPKVQEYLLEVGAYWIREFDIDGWRLDVSNEVSHDFWRRFRKEMKKIKEDLFILGENWDDAMPWLYGDQFDAVMNYDFLTAVWGVLGDETQVARKYTSKTFKEKISHLLAKYPKHLSANQFNLLDSHDTSRIRSILGSRDKVELAFVLQMTFGGAPSIYYGSEVGLEGFGDGNRKCMVWDKEKRDEDLRCFLKELIDLRKTQPAMKAVDLTFHDTEEELLLFSKEADGNKLFVGINLGDQAKLIAHEKPGRLAIARRCSKTSKGFLLDPNGFFILIE